MMSSSRNKCCNLAPLVNRNNKRVKERCQEVLEYRGLEMECDWKRQSRHVLERVPAKTLALLFGNFLHQG